MHKNTVCLDTNILIDLSEIYYNNIKEIKTIKKLNPYYYTQINYLLNLIEKNEIEIIILPMVLLEAAEVSKRRNFKTMEFLKEFKDSFQVVTYSDSEIKEKIALIDQLAKVYCRKSTVITKKRKIFKLEPIFETFSKTGPSHDATIMAQTAVLGFPIVTKDRHFLQERRPDRIFQMNKYFVNSSARPYSLKDYMYKVMGLSYQDFVQQDIKPTFQETAGACMEAY